MFKCQQSCVWTFQGRVPICLGYFLNNYLFDKLAVDPVLGGWGRQGWRGSGSHRWVGAGIRAVRRKWGYFIAKRGIKYTVKWLFSVPA